MSGGTRTPEFLALNPSHTIPTIVDDGFALFESNAILVYLAKKYNWTAYYPADAQLRARIDQYLNWHHTNTRLVSSQVFFHLITGNMTAEKLPKALKKLKKPLRILEGWLGQSQFLVCDQPTIADLAAYCELDQVTTKGPFLTLLFQNHAPPVLPTSCPSCWFEYVWLGQDCRFLGLFSLSQCQPMDDCYGATPTLGHSAQGHTSNSIE